MDKSTPKSFRSIAEKSKLLASTPSYFDRDVELEKQYLQKLKSQRIKAQKLYTQYKAILKDRDKTRQQKEQLQQELDSLKSKLAVVAQENKVEIIKLTSTNERLEAEVRTLKTEQMEYYSFKHRYESTLKDMEKQIQLTEQQRQETHQTVEQLQEEIQRLESQNRRLKQQLEEEKHAVQIKLSRSETNRQRLEKDYQREKQAYSNNKRLWDQEREQITQTLTLKTQQLNSLRIDLDNQLKEKDRLYQIAVSELQETKVFWKVKIDEKNREIATFKKNIDSFKEECKKWKAENQKQRQRSKDNQERENQLRQNLSEVSAKLKAKETEYSQLHAKYLRTIEDAQRLESRIQELDGKLRIGEQTNRRLQQSCQEYLKIIEKMEREEQRRLFLAESEYQEIDRMEQIFSTFQ